MKLKRKAPVSPEIAEVRVPERLLGGDPLVGIVGAHLVNELYAVLGRVGDQLLDTRALLRRKIEIYPPVSTVECECRIRNILMLTLFYGFSIYFL